MRTTYYSLVFAHVSEKCRQNKSNIFLPQRINLISIVYLVYFVWMWASSGAPKIVCRHNRCGGLCAVISNDGEIGLVQIWAKS